MIASLSVLPLSHHHQQFTPNASGGSENCDSSNENPSATSSDVLAVNTPDSTHATIFVVLYILRFILHPVILFSGKLEQELAHVDNGIEISRRLYCGGKASIVNKCRANGDALRRPK